MTVTQPIAAQPAWQPPAPKPPLTAREKTGALVAGGVGYLLLSLGWVLFGIPLAVLAFGAFFALIFGAIQRAAGDQGPLGFLEALDLNAWIVPLLLSSLVGLVIMAVSLIASRGILRSYGVTKPWAVTFAGAGIAIVGSWIVSAVLTIPLQFSGVLSDGDNTGPVALVVGGLSLLVSVVATAAIGAFAWWWMAHLMRPAARTLQPPTPSF